MTEHAFPKAEMDRIAGKSESQPAFCLRGSGRSGNARFQQRLDLYRGRVLIEIGEEGEGVRLEVWGHPHGRDGGGC